MKTLLVLLLLAVPSVSRAATADSLVAAPLATTGAFFALSVADLEASARWYAEKLGLKVVMQVPKHNQSAVTVLEGGGLMVELIQHDGAQPLAKAAPGLKGGNLSIHGPFKTGIRVDDFDRAIATLKARGVPIAIGPFPARKDQRANAIIKDNAGNFIQVLGDYAR